MRQIFFVGVVLLALMQSAHAKDISEPVTVSLTGDWTVRVETRQGNTDLTVNPADICSVQAEKYDVLPLYDEKGPIYRRGAVLKQIKAQECATAFAVDPASIVVQKNPETDSVVYEKDKDYRIEPTWGGIGRTAESRIGEKQPVYINYVYGKMRIDSVVQVKDGKIVLKKGTPHVSIPEQPFLEDGETRLANIWIKARIDKLTPELLFPILETAYPESPAQKPCLAEQLIPKTWAKLNAGEKVRILAWGDSVTDAGYLPDKNTQRWQEQFVARLRAKFPKSQIELITEAWGGRNTDSYRNEPPGSPKNYQEKVLAQRPDLIVSEFVNDSGYSGDALNKRYSRILDEFKEIGAEWIILTPHYVRTDWMGLNRERDIDDDPRPYVKSVREFAVSNNVALADASKRYGRLWRQGIPYSTLMMNNINHPNSFGMKLFADALMELFQ